MKPYHIVITTIGNGAILADIGANLYRNDHLKDTEVWIVADRKTPAECRLACHYVNRFGLTTHYMDVEEQDRFGKKFSGFYSRLPWNTDARRNVGYLAALDAGCEWMILLDDDNYPRMDDLIGWHTRAEAVQVATNVPYYNYMTALGYKNIYPRGYPYKDRNAISAWVDVIDDTVRIGKVGVNVGLWSGAPDIDAVTALTHPDLTSEGKLDQDHLSLPRDTWTPINSQNTAIRRELIPASMFVIQKYPGKMGLLDRYGDIFAGYFLQAVMRQTDYRVAFGRPIVEHRRNPHDLLNDMQDEHVAILLLEWLLPKLREWRPQSENVIEQVKKLAAWVMGLDSREIDRSHYGCKGWLYDTSITLAAWAEACEAIGI